MKKVIILLGILLSFLTVDAAAQINDGRWFVGAGAGLNVGFDGQKFISREQSHIGAGMAVELNVGKFFTERIGFRAGYHGLSTSDYYTVFGRDKFHFIHADALFAVAEVVVPYVHAGVAILEKVTPAGGLGIMFPVPLSDRVLFTPDIKATLLSGAGFANGAPRLGMNLSATLGVVVLLGN